MKNVNCLMVASLLLAGCRVMTDATTDGSDTHGSLEVRYYPIGRNLFWSLDLDKTWFRILNNSMDEAMDGERKMWMAFFAPFGVTWPNGSTIGYVNPIGKIRVCTTSQNHAQIARALLEVDREADPIPAQRLIEVESRFIEVPTSMLGALSKQGEGVGAQADAALEQQLLAGPDLRRNQSWKVVTESGVEAVGKSVTECVYPTEYDIKSIAQVENSCTNALVAVEPKSFMMREVGMVVSVTPNVSEDGKVIDLNLMAQVIDDPEWRDYGFKVPTPGAVKYKLPMEQPFFAVNSFDAKVSMCPGASRCVGKAEVKSRDGENRTLFCFVRVNWFDGGDVEK